MSAYFSIFYLFFHEDMHLAFVVYDEFLCLCTFII